MRYLRDNAESGPHRDSRSLAPREPCDRQVAHSTCQRCSCKVATALRSMPAGSSLRRRQLQEPSQADLLELIMHEPPPIDAEDRVCTVCYTRLARALRVRSAGGKRVRHTSSAALRPPDTLAPHASMLHQHGSMPFVDAGCDCKPPASRDANSDPPAEPGQPAGPVGGRLCVRFAIFTKSFVSKQ